ncbi:hypothetical protein [Shewanella sp. HN-41]|uniref:hypothetical protein n=1 Tax=Shewanella sp. HN-41 TaxID=327275 RepID=UPI0002125C71|nr:hypothetical protein [Shewanella sp. HN-41]EGM70689.1 hypothetical protein SOHN41_01445 [Shewanella sp. HN-41]
MNQAEPSVTGKAILDAVEQQIKNNDPPKVKQTLKRLKSLGISRKESIKYIAFALSIEIFGVLKNEEEFNPQRYNDNLDKLPELPWEDE